MFANIEVIFRIKSYLEMNNLRVLEVSDKCSKLTQYVGC